MAESAPSTDDGAAVNGHTSNKNDRLSFFIGGINPEVTKDELLEYLSKFVPSDNIDIKMDMSTGKNRGYAFISVKRDASFNVEEFLSTKHVLREKQVDVRELGKRTDQQAPERPRVSASLANRYKIFIGGITPSITDEVLHQHFVQFGAIEKATVIRDGAGKSRGFGFVQFQSIESVSAAVEASPHQLDDENKVDAQPAQDRGAKRVPGRYPGSASPYGAGYDPSQQGYYSAQSYTYGSTAGPYGYTASTYSPMYGSPYGGYARTAGYTTPYAAAGYGQQAYTAEGYSASPTESMAYGAVRRGDPSAMGYPSATTTRPTRGAPY